MKHDMSIFPDIKDIKFISPPEKLGLSSYKEVREYMIDHFSKSSDVVSLYEFGTVNAPSISDIDLMLVLKDTPSENIHNLIDRNSVSPLVKYLMMDNTLMILNEEGFRNIPLWDDMVLNNLYGKDIQKLKVSNEDKVSTEIARVMDWLPERTMRMIELVSRREIPTRATLCLINSFIYILERLRDSFDLKFEGVENYIKTFHNLRTDWFDIDNRDEILYNYLKNGIYLGFQAMNSFDEYCIKNGFYDTSLCPSRGTFRLNPKITSWTKQKMYYHFESDIEKITASESYNRCISSSHSSIIVVPMSYYQHILSYGLNNKLISSKIFQSLDPVGNHEMSSCVDKNLRKVLNKRIEIIDNMGIFLKNNSINSGLLKFGWFL